MVTPYIVGIGGTLRKGSTNEIALRIALASAADSGASVEAFCGEDLDLPFYDPKLVERTPRAERLVAALRAADGVIVASPGYHGGLSGIIKNALDYVEDMAKDDRIYLGDIPFGCISVSNGSHGAVAVLSNLRSIAHSLRAYPTPYGAAIVGSPHLFQGSECIDPEAASRLRLIGSQVAEMAARYQRLGV